MKKVALVLSLFALVCASPASATAVKKVGAQQNRMKTCAAEYHKKGIAKHQYRAFMKECLKTKHKKTSDAAKPKTMEHVLAAVHEKK